MDFNKRVTRLVGLGLAAAFLAVLGYMLLTWCAKDAMACVAYCLLLFAGILHAMLLHDLVKMMKERRAQKTGQEFDE